MLLAPMMQSLEGLHVSFFQKVTQKQATWQRDKYWRQGMAEAVLQGEGTQLLQTYVDIRQARVMEWVPLRPILDVCARETGYEGGGRLRVPWWRQEAAENQLKIMVEAILEAARVQRLQESGRRGESKGGSDGGSWKDNDRGKTGNIGEMGWIQVTPRCLDNHVRRNDGRW